MEPVKDLYRELNVSPSATTEEIKKAFRQLAQQYHPDKHGNNLWATEKFTEIREAYHTLSDRKRRAEYNYQRYLQNPLFASKPRANSAEDIFQLSSKLKKEITAIAPFRIDRDVLFFQLQELLSEAHLNILRTAHDISINRQIVNHTIPLLEYLSLYDMEIIAAKLKELAAGDSIIRKELLQSISETTQAYYWNRYKILVALAVALLFCIFVYITKG